MDDIKLARIGEGYLMLMMSIKDSVDVIHKTLRGKISTGYQHGDYELMALNFRKIAELIIYANLVGHEAEYAALNPKYMFEWRLQPIINKIKQVNPQYYPWPSDEKGLDEEGRLCIEPVPQSEWMGEDELIEMYDLCAQLLHAKNPFQVPINLSDYTGRFELWLQKIIRLLNHHTVNLADGLNSIWFSMATTNNGEPQLGFAKIVSTSNGSV